MLDRHAFFVYGRVVDDGSSLSEGPLAVVAFSSRYIAHEPVDIAQFAHAGTHYGLNLPEGRYELLVFADLNQNSVYEQTEVVGRRSINLNAEDFSDKVADNIDIPLSEPVTTDWPVNNPVSERRQLEESIFFPNGAIRDLGDRLFDPAMASLGMYEPAAFLSEAPTMFYALEEDSYKIPVIFVHGIGGSPREFLPIIDALDRSMYKPWFFYYPSGNDLDQLAEMFYEIFLSGHAVTDGSRLIIIAHSMGGLVVREALNKYRGNKGETKVGLLISIATPFGGHPAAATGEALAPLVLPSWRNLNPEGSFIQRLYRKPMPVDIQHYLLYAFGNSDTVKFGENSDGVVPLSSQLFPAAQKQATVEFGFNDSHTGVLTDPVAIAYIMQAIEQSKIIVPEPHLKANLAGGYDVELDASYNRQEQYYIRQRGKYMAMLANGSLDTLGDPILEHFVAVAQGRAEAGTTAETAWIKFIRDYPQYVK